MRKLKHITIFVIGVLIMVSCSDWLSVSPKTEKEQGELFEKESGFKDALIGAYIQLKNENAYGQALTMTTIEDLVSFWDATAGSALENFNKHNYTASNCESAINGIYGQLYKIISTVNAILNNIEQNKSVFVTEGMYEIVKGEALAIRALCHLDLLRLFGPVPTQPNDSKILPYVTVLGKELNIPITYQEYCKLLLRDIADAADLLKNDPIRKVLNKEEEERLDLFFKARTYRMNYYAVKALQARTNLYLGYKDVAYEAAKEVVQAKANASDRFSLGTSAHMDEQDFTLTSEHIFAIHDQNLYIKYQAFATGGMKKGNEPSVILKMFGNTGTDIRETYLWSLETQKNGTKTYSTKKYFAVKNEGNGIQDSRIPILRLSEMYLILVEVAPISEALTYWSKYLRARGIAPYTIREETRLNYVVNEYRKEFYGEGLMFYTHKRLNSSADQIMWFKNSSSDDPNYVLPLPQSEIVIKK